MNLGKLDRLMQTERDVLECTKCGMSFTGGTCPDCGGQGKPKWKWNESKQKMIKTVRKGYLNKEERVFHKEMCNNMALYYGQLQNDFSECPDCKGSTEALFETIECLPRETKADLVPFIKRKVDTYTKQDMPEMAKEASILADTLQNKVALCSIAGRPSRSWLRRKGYTTDDLVKAGNILQVKK
jgi:hypothetical protein